MKPSARHADDARALLEFRNAYVELLNASRPEAAIVLPKLVAAVPMPEWLTKREQVAKSAGAAAFAYRRHGGTMTLRNAAYVMHDVDPVLNWEHSLADPEQLPPERVIAAAAHARSRAETLAREAAGRERGLTGLLAAFLRWPGELREAVGPDRPVQQRAAGVVGVISQVVVGTVTAGVGGVVTAGLIAACAALWRTVA